MQSPKTKIREGDIVTMPDGSTGVVLQVFAVGSGCIFKILISDDCKEVYFDESKVSLKRHSIRNLLSDLLGGKIVK